MNILAVAKLKEIIIRTRIRDPLQQSTQKIHIVSINRELSLSKIHSPLSNISISKNILCPSNTKEIETNIQSQSDSQNDKDHETIDLYPPFDMILKPSGNLSHPKQISNSTTTIHQLIIFFFRKLQLKEIAYRNGTNPCLNTLIANARLF